jgi:hypothetical protein
VPDGSQFAGPGADLRRGETPEGCEVVCDLGVGVEERDIAVCAPFPPVMRWSVAVQYMKNPRRRTRHRIPWADVDPLDAYIGLLHRPE